uniref:Uncharacterized protein n=1 Tax=Timema tahoe TaxID=61484 RepID=A0A7R9IHW6_9NEOP|nr:unnamed protein product [Timema tahoe]
MCHLGYLSVRLINSNRDVTRGGKDDYHAAKRQQTTRLISVTLKLQQCFDEISNQGTDLTVSTLKWVTIQSTFVYTLISVPNYLSRSQAIIDSFYQVATYYNLRSSHSASRTPSVAATGLTTPNIGKNLKSDKPRYLNVPKDLAGAPGLETQNRDNPN